MLKTCDSFEIPYHHEHDRCSIVAEIRKNAQLNIFDDVKKHEKYPSI